MRLGVVEPLLTDQRSAQPEPPDQVPGIAQHEVLQIAGVGCRARRVTDFDESPQRPAEARLQVVVELVVELLEWLVQDGLEEVHRGLPAAVPF